MASAPVIYPQCWARLSIRVEDFKARGGFVPDPNASGDPVGASAFLGIDHVVLPQTCTVNLRSYREGDEAKIEIPASALPIDPRIIRQGTLQIFMGLLDPKEFSDSQGPINGGARTRLIPENSTELDPTTGLPRINEVFRGFFDDLSVTYDGDDMIKISCRDITAVFIDEEVPVQALKGIPAETPIDQVIQLIISGEPSALGVPPDNREERSFKIEARRNAKRLQASLTATLQRLAKATTAIPPSEDEITRLSDKVADLTAELATANATAALADSKTVIAPIYGIRGARGVKVVNDTGAPLRTLATLKGAAWFDSKKGLVRASKRGTGNEKISYWDLITDICVGCGYICYVRTNAGLAALSAPQAEIVISNPRTYYVEKLTEVRKFIYGYNVDTMTLQRNYGGRDRPTAVIVQATSSLDGSPVVGRYPPLKLNNKGGIDPTGIDDKEDAETYLLNDAVPCFGQASQEAGIANVSGANPLPDIARSIYEQRSRGEMEVTIETTMPSAFPSNDSRTYADLLALRAADTIEIEITPPFTFDPSEPIVTPAAAFMALSKDDKIARLIEAHKFSPELAAAVATAYDSEFLQKQFRVKEVKIDFSHDDGFNFQIDAVSYLDARNSTLAVGGVP